VGELDEVGFAMTRNQQEKRRCGRQLKFDTILDMYKL